MTQQRFPFLTLPGKVDDSAALSFFDALPFLLLPGFTCLTISQLCWLFFRRFTVAAFATASAFASASASHCHCHCHYNHQNLTFPLVTIGFTVCNCKWLYIYFFITVLLILSFSLF